MDCGFLKMDYGFLKMDYGLVKWIRVSPKINLRY